MSRLLYLTDEEWPTFRVDVTILFGAELPRYGIQTDLVAAGGDRHAVERWPAGELHLCSLGRTTKVANDVRKLLHSLRRIWAARPPQVHAIQVRDMPVVAFFGLLVARMRALTFFYWMSYPQSEGQIDRARQRGPCGGLRYWAPLLRGSIGQWLLYRWVIPHADHVFVQSEQMARDVSAKGVPMHRLTPVVMGFDPAHADPVASCPPKTRG